MRYVLVLVVALSVTAGSAAAQSLVPSLDQQGRTADVARLVKEKTAARFDAADQNKDGNLSKEEISKYSDYMAKNFETLDTDKNGLLRWEEFVGHNRWPK